MRISCAIFWASQLIQPKFLLRMCINSLSIIVGVDAMQDPLVLSCLWSAVERLSARPRLTTELQDSNVAPWTPQCLLCRPLAPPSPHPLRTQHKIMLLLCLNHTLRCLDVSVCVLSRTEFHVSCLKWNQKLGSWTGVLKACAWQRSNFAPRVCSGCFNLSKGRSFEQHSRV